MLSHKKKAKELHICNIFTTFAANLYIPQYSQ